MGILNRLFGGGTKLALSLDASQAPAGGVLSGTLTLESGKKQRTLTSPKVRLLYLLVKSSDDSPLPEVKTEMLIDQTLAAGETLPAKSSRDYEFSFHLPADLDPSGDGVSYKVMAVADIPKVADPKADATLTIVAGSRSTRKVMSLDAIYARWPDLRSDDEEALTEALREVMLACYDDDERTSLQALEPILARHIRTGAAEVRTQALDAWANLLDDCARKEHIAFLRELIGQAGGDSDFRREVITAAAKFADEGALPLIKELAKSDDAEVRQEVADQLRFAAADQFRGKLKVLKSMMDDPAPGVRAAVFGAFSDFREDKKLMKMVAERADSDPSEEVQAACISTLALIHYEGLADLQRATYTKHLANPSQLVRKEIASNLNSFAEEDVASVRGLAQRLLQDNDPEVRRATAWQFVNLSEFPALAPLGKAAAANDPVPSVRRDALYGLNSMLPINELAAFYRERLAADQTSEAAWGVLSGLRDHTDTPEGQALLQELSRSQHSEVASSAREALSG